MFASSQAPIAQFSQVVSEVKQQVATLRQRIQKLDHDAREFAGEEVAEAAVRRARGGEPSSDLRRCLAGPGGREQRTHRMAFQGSSTAKPNSQSKQKSTDIDLTSLDVNSLSGHEARRLLSVRIASFLSSKPNILMSCLGHHRKSPGYTRTFASHCPS